MSAETISASFGRVLGLLRPAMARADDGDIWTEDEVLNELLTGRAQLWEGERAVVVTRCFAEPPTIHIWLAGGKMADVMALLDGGLAWARPLGIKWASCKGRAGWRRVLRNYGFEGDDVLRRRIA